MKYRSDYSFMFEIREDYQLLIRNKKIKTTDKIPFICPIHGEYWQSLNNHSNKKQRCPKCSFENKIKTEYPFIEEIREDYRILIKEGKIKAKDKVPFICKEHGEYWQSLDHHYNQKQGCPKCAIEKRKRIHLIKHFW